MNDNQSTLSRYAAGSLRMVPVPLLLAAALLGCSGGSDADVRAASATGGGEAVREVRMNQGAALAAKLESPPPTALPAGWEYRETFRSLAPGNLEPPDPDVAPEDKEPIPLDQLEEHTAEQVRQRMEEARKQPPPDPIDLGHYYYYAPATSKAGNPLLAMEQGQPFVVVAVVPQDVVTEAALREYAKTVGFEAKIVNTGAENVAFATPPGVELSVAESLADAVLYG